MSRNIPTADRISIHLFLDYDGDLTGHLLVDNDLACSNYSTSGRHRDLLNAFKQELPALPALRAAKLTDYFTDEDFLEACAFTWNSRRFPEPIREDAPVILCAGDITYDGLSIRAPAESTPQPAQPEVIIHDFIF